MKRTVVWLLHSGYWLLFAALLLTFFFFAVLVPAHVHAGPRHGNGIVSWLKLMAGFAILPGLLSFYACYTFLFEHILGRQRFWLFFMASLLTAFLAAVVGAGVASLPFLFGKAFLFGDGYASALFVLLSMTGIAWLNGIMGAVIKSSLTWYRDIRLKDELYQKNMETELALLKSQIDPHFLFNTLNNIDILITRDAGAASVYLNKLSGILRFLLYETKNERISLERELVYLQQYIDLQKIRTSHKEYVDFKIAGQFAGLSIAPMILLPFIENAFKHTEHHKATSSIRIHLQLDGNRLLFSCSNTLYAEKTEKTVAGGLGNSLIRKRLALLYPDTHTLTATAEGQLYLVRLELDL